MIPIRNKPSYVALHPGSIEKTFTDAVIDLKEIIVLDGIDILPDDCGFRVRSHDLHGQLPEIVIRDSGNAKKVLLGGLAWIGFIWLCLAIKALIEKIKKAASPKD